MADDNKKIGMILHSADGSLGDRSNDPARQLHEKLHASITKTQAEFGKMEVCGASGGGMVQVKMNCERKVRAVEISAEIFADREMVQDLVASAITDALAKVEDAISEKMRTSVESALSSSAEKE